MSRHPRTRLSIVDKLEVLGKEYNFSLKLYSTVENFDRKYKFTIGDRIIVSEELAEELIIDANGATDPFKAAEYVHDALTHLEKVETKLRRATALGLMSPETEGLLYVDLDDIRGSAKKWRSYFLKECRKIEQERQKEGRNSAGEQDTPTGANPQ